MTDPTRREILDRLVAAVNARDGAVLAALGSSGMLVTTDRSERSGSDAVKAWAERGYDHIDRRWVVDLVREAATGELVAVGRSQYLWRESGEVGDQAPIALVLSFDESGAIERLRVLDAPADAPA